MEINKIVYMCKDDHSLLDEMLRNKEITISDYQKAKMVLEDEELCQLSCIKYEQSLTAADKITSTIKNFDSEAVKGTAKEALSNDKVKKFKPALIILVVAIIAASGFSFYKTFIYKIPFDLGDNIILKMSDEAFSGEAEAEDVKIFTNFEYYNESGFYDDMKTELVDKGLSKKEAESLVPTYDQTTFDHFEGLDFSPEFSKTTNIKNGDEISVNFTYDKEYAKQNKIKVKNNTMTLKVSDLAERVTKENYQTADMTGLQSACDKYLSREKIEDYNNGYGGSDVTINKIGTCGYAVENYDGNTYGAQMGTLFVETNESDRYKDSYDQTYEIEGDMYIENGKYKFKVNTDYGSGIDSEDEDYQTILEDNNHLIIKKAENVDMESDDE